MNDKNPNNLVITAAELDGIQPFRIVIRGKRHVIPSMDQMPLSTAVEIAQLADSDMPAALELLLNDADESARKAVMGLPLQFARRFLASWLQVSEDPSIDSVGESAPSGS